MAINNARSRNGGIGVCQKMRMNFKKDFGMMSIHAAWWISDRCFSYLIQKSGIQKCVIKMSSFKFGQNEAASKDFYKQRQVTEIFTIEVNKFVLSNEVSCNNG